MKYTVGTLLLCAGLLASCSSQPSPQTAQSGSVSPAGQVLPDSALQAQFFPRRPVAPPPGKDIVVFNDANIFNDLIGAPADPQNQLMFKNLVNYATSGPRGTSLDVWVDRGHGGNACNNECTDAKLADFQNAMTSAGYNVVFKNTNVGDLATLPASVKVLVLFMPTQSYDKAEINAMKAFANDGGRVVFVGEWDGFYSGIAVQNAFLLQMGAVMTNTGGAVDCGANTVPATSLRASQITTGLTSLKMGCSSTIAPGPNDFIFMYDQTNKIALAGVARIDTTPLP